MSDSLQRVVGSLVRQGSQKPDTAVLPHWIFDGAQLTYVSSSSGDALDVEVEHVSQSKRQVKFIFSNDRRAWKSVSFEQIIAGRNPLMPRKGVAKPLRAKKVTSGSTGDNEDVDELEKLAGEMETTWDSEPSKQGKVQGPSVSSKMAMEVPTHRKWRGPEVVDLETKVGKSPPVVFELDPPPQDLDAAEPPSDPDPYGLQADVNRGRCDTGPQATSVEVENHPSKAKGDRSNRHSTPQSKSRSRSRRRGRSPRLSPSQRIREPKGRNVKRK